MHDMQNYLIPDEFSASRSAAREGDDMRKCAAIPVLLYANRVSEHVPVAAFC